MHAVRSDRILIGSVTLRRRPRAAWLWNGARCVLGVTLLAAAALKGYELATSPVASGDGLWNSRPLLIAAVEYELVLGVWLLAGWRPVWAHRVALATFALFAAVALYKAHSGDASCGCFGRLTVSPWLTFGFDTLAVAALAVARPQLAQGNEPRHRIALAAAACAAIVGGAGGWAMLSYDPAAVAEDGDLIGGDSFVVLEPEAWVGRTLPLLPHIDIGERLREGEWLVVLYRHDCGHCVESLPRYERLAAESAARRVALIEMPPFAPPEADPVSPSTRCVRGRLSDAREWFVQTPAVLATSGGVVTAFGEEPAQLE